MPDDIVDIDEDGIHKKAEWIKTIEDQKKGGFLFRDFKFEDPNLIRLGPDAALFTAKEIIHVVDKGKPVEQRFYTLACYVGRDGKWVPRFYQDTTAQSSD